jgi:hypothetical protein
LLVVCGRNDRLRRKLAAVPGLVVVGWTDPMPDLMRACDLAVLDSALLSPAIAAAVTFPAPTLSRSSSPDVLVQKIPEVCGLPELHDAALKLVG